MEWIDFKDHEPEIGSINLLYVGGSTGVIPGVYKGRGTWLGYDLEFWSAYADDIKYWMLPPLPPNK
jgi:hypothetical protein